MKMALVSKKKPNPYGKEQIKDERRFKKGHFDPSGLAPWLHIRESISKKNSR